MLNMEKACLASWPRRMLSAVDRAVQRFLLDPPCIVGEELRAKPGVASRDLLRLAHVNQRYLDMLLSIRCPNAVEQPATLGVCAFALAIRGWLRQIQIHSACYTYIQRRRNVIHDVIGPSAGDTGSRSCCSGAQRCRPSRLFWQ